MSDTANDVLTRDELVEELRRSKIALEGTRQALAHAERLLLEMHMLAKRSAELSEGVYREEMHRLKTGTVEVRLTAQQVEALKHADGSGLR